jgi:hypothetical protein
MPLLRKIWQVEIIPTSKYSINGGCPAFEFELEGYPSREAKEDDRGINGGEGGWFLSRETLDLQEVLPVQLRANDDSPELKAYGYADEPEGNFWLFKSSVYLTADKKLNAVDVRALVNVEINKRRLVLEKAHAVQAVTDNYDNPRRRESISQTVRVEVWQRDGGRCVDCLSQEKLEFDHIIPVAMGGGNTSRNLQLLCETCNRRKGASLG